METNLKKDSILPGTRIVGNIKEIKVKNTIYKNIEELMFDENNKIWFKSNGEIILTHLSNCIIVLLDKPEEKL